MIDLKLEVLPNLSDGTITVYADQALDNIPFGHFENLLERIRGIELVLTRRYSIELTVAEHVTTVYRAGMDVIAVLTAEAETLQQFWDYHLVSVDAIYRTPKLGVR